MKKTFINIVLLLFLFVSVNSQTNKQNIKISDPLSEIIDADFWFLSPEGEWVRNNIKDIAIVDNFIKLELIKIYIEDKEYLILIRKYIGFHYRNEIKKEGFYTSADMEYYVFPVNQTKFIIPENLKFNTKYSVELKTILFGEIKSYKNFNIKKRILSDIDENFRKYNKFNKTIDLKLFLNPVFENKMRFFFQKTGTGNLKKTIDNFNISYFEVNK